MTKKLFICLLTAIGIITIAEASKEKIIRFGMKDIIYEYPYDFTSKPTIVATVKDNEGNEIFINEQIALQLNNAFKRANDSLIGTEYYDDVWIIKLSGNNGSKNEALVEGSYYLLKQCISSLSDENEVNAIQKLLYIVHDADEESMYIQSAKSASRNMLINYRTDKCSASGNDMKWTVDQDNRLKQALKALYTNMNDDIYDIGNIYLGDIVATNLSIALKDILFQASPYKGLWVITGIEHIKNSIIDVLDDFISDETLSILLNDREYSTLLDWIILAKRNNITNDIINTVSKGCFNADSPWLELFSPFSLQTCIDENKLETVEFVFNGISAYSFSSTGDEVPYEQ